MISNHIGLIRSDLLSWLDGVGGFIVRKFDSNSVFLRNETDFATEDLIEISTVFFLFCYFRIRSFFQCDSEILLGDEEEKEEPSGL